VKPVGLSPSFLPRLNRIATATFCEFILKAVIAQFDLLEDKLVFFTRCDKVDAW
jgi:hypothetical protein